MRDPVMRYMASQPVGVYMAPCPTEYYQPLPPTVATTTLIMGGGDDRRDLEELLASVDEYVTGKTITEDIMKLRAKVAAIRDRMERRPK